MKLALCAVLSLLLIGTAAAGQSNISIGKLRLADAASDACFANCAQPERCLQTRMPDHAWRTLPERM